MSKELNVDEILDKLDRNSRKARIISLTFTGLLVVIALSILCILYWLITKAKDELADLEQQTAAAQKRNKTLEKEYQDEVKVGENAVKIIEEAKARNNSGTAGEKLDEAIKVLQGSQSNPDSPPTPRVTPTPPPGVPARKTVYIQIVDNSQREKAQIIRKSMTSNLNAKYSFPGVDLIEKLKGKMSATQVKYFRDEDRPAAEELAAQLKGQNVTDVRIVHARGDSNILEIWFSDSFQ